MFVNHLSVTAFHDLAVKDHNHAMGEIPHNSEVVRHEQIANAEL
jgi:hypothetical protein